MFPTIPFEASDGIDTPGNCHDNDEVIRGNVGESKTINYPLDVSICNHESLRTIM